MQKKLLQLVIKLCRISFGTFEEEELKKFLYMGFIFSLLVGIYWTLRPLRDSIFIQLVNISHIPYAKIFSTLSLIPLIIIYTKLLNYFTREKMMFILSGFYGIGILCFAISIFFIQPILIKTVSFQIILGYLWHTFVTSFGYFFMELFWGFATDITEPESAKKGFPLIVTIGQLGGIICPYSIGGLPHYLKLETDLVSMLILSFLTLSIISLTRSFTKNTPKSLLTSFQQDSLKENPLTESSSFLEGIKLLFSHRYLIGIFILTAIYETVITIFEFSFRLAASAQYTGVELSHYFSIYGSTVNMVSLLCLLLGISNITRFLGMRVALAITPIIIGILLLGFLTIDSLSFLFFLMVSSKAINYALNGPTLKQLYIPTSKNVRFKAQAWIETFGPIVSLGTFTTMTLTPLQRIFGEIAGKTYYFAFISILSLPLIIIWFWISIYLGYTANMAAREKTIIC